MHAATVLATQQGYSCTALRMLLLVFHCLAHSPHKGLKLETNCGYCWERTLVCICIAYHVPSEETQDIAMHMHLVQDQGFPIAAVAHGYGDTIVQQQQL